ncbi:MAG: HDIG domain-containing protein [Roseiflexaceae bacterium]|nr:HDIG domain-containing protein [Roseiflexaceae bacterium]
MKRRWPWNNQREARQASTVEQQERQAWRSFWLLTLCFWLLVWSILVARAPVATNIVAGKPSPVTVQSRREVSYLSEVRTEEARAKIETDPETIVYTRDTSIPTTQRNQLTDLLLTVTQIRDDPTLGEAEQLQQLVSLPNSSVVITETMAGEIAQLSDEQWTTTRQLSVELYDRAMRETNFELTDQDVRNLRERSLPYWASQRGTGSPYTLAVTFASPFLKANRIVDELATQESKQDARNNVVPVRVTVLEGESVIREGDIVTADSLEKLAALGELESDLNPMRIVGRALLAALAAGLLAAFIASSHHKIWKRPRSIAVIYGLAATTLLLARAMIGLPLGLAWPYAFPLGAAVLLLAALFDSGIALLVAVVLSFLIGFTGGSNFGLAMVLLFSATAGVFALGRGERSLRFVWAGAVVASVTALVQFTLWSLTIGINEQWLPGILLMSAVNGILTIILALGLYNLVGQAAGIATPFQLMELSNPSQPLLRKLVREAPGTYYHSVSVANLAESAAEAIGADALLLRVAAYYHDVGKAARPYFYTDNQSDRENVHNELDPKTSAQIIADHVREGVNMARSARLPQQIIDFIPAHHGTSVIQHFYQLALRQEDSVDVADYRYPGPKPRTREQAVLMLADTVEATVRAKSQHGKLITAKQKADGAAQNGAQTLEELVATLIEEKMRNGQLDESPVTLQELTLIRQAFLTTLQGIYHPRVEYAPQLVKTN